MSMSLEYRFARQEDVQSLTDKKNAWKDSKKIRVEVLVGNLGGISFCKAVGFKGYCITMGMEN